MDVILKDKAFAYKVALLLLAILFCTYVRALLLLIYPLAVITAFYIFKWKLDRNALYLLALAAVCWLLSFRNGLYLRYNFVSFYYFIPFLLLLFAVPSKERTGYNYLRMLMNALTFVAILNNIAGIVQYIARPGDDSFTGIYGVFTVSQNGLSILNAILFFYHFTNYQYHRKTVNLVLFCFFIICCVMGFYGAGQLVLIASLMLTYLRIRPKNIIQLVVITLLTFSAVVILMKIISPVTLEYNVAIIKKFLDPDAPGAPRKLMVFKNYFNAYFMNPLDLIFGSGPGTFNSRSAFMVGSPYYFSLPAIKSEVQPHYFLHYAYTLWNNTNTGPYDGFMNQPFSSIIALLGEYGLLLTLLTLYALTRRFTHFSRLSRAFAKSAGVSVEAKMYRFCTIYALLLIIIDNYMEYPEIIGLLLIIIKLSQQQLRKAFNT